MSNKRFQARAKKVQKLGRDGLVERDKATGEERRVSQRAADVSFGPDRTPEEGMRRPPAQKKKRRKQPRPLPPPEAVQAADANAVTDFPDARQADDGPAVWQTNDRSTVQQTNEGTTAQQTNNGADMRQADDGPIPTPSPIKDGGAAPRRRRQTRANRLKADTTARLTVEDSIEGGQLQFEERPTASDPQPHGVDEADTSTSDMGPSHRQQKRTSRVNLDAPTHSMSEDRGRLQFEPEQDRPSGPTRQEEGPTPPRGVVKATERARSPGRPVPSPTHRRGKGGGRLQFEAEQSSPPTVADTRTQRANNDAADASTGPQPHEGTSGVELSSTPASAPTPKSDTPPPNRKYQKAVRRVERAEERVEQARADLPTKRRLSFQPEPDSETGKPRRRLHFEQEVLPEYRPPSLPARAGGMVKTAAVMKLHGKIRESERDNVAVEAAHKGEFAVERGAGRVLRWNKQRLRSKPYRALRQAERRAAKEIVNLAWQTALRDNPALRHKNVLSRWIQKQKIKRKYVQAARETQKGVRHTQQMFSAAGKAARAVQHFASAHRGALMVMVLAVLVVVLFSSALVSCVAMLSGVQSAYTSTVYLANEQEICDSELYFTELETDLQLDIAQTEANHPGYDEYRYHIGEISHSPYELMNYLSAVYGAFTFSEVKPELERLFAEKYQLTRTEITETRYDDEGDPYQWRVLQTTLTVKRLGDIISASLTPGDESDLYTMYGQTMGNRQAFGNPFDFPWLSYATSGYGWRVHSTTGAKDLHRGVDIAVAQGTPIKAIQDGRVVSAGNAGSYGLCAVIEDENGYQSRYAHCSSLSVSAGQEVKRGDVIGAVGSTGDSAGPHLHLEVLLDGEYLDPYYFVDAGGGEVTEPSIPDDPGTPMGDDRFQAMLAEAEKYLGYPYVWGGTNPTTSFDCAGYVSWVINHCGVGWNYGRLGVMGLEDICTPVSKADAKPGDLVFFIGTYDAPYPNRPTHVGIYVGGGRFIHCGDPISYANLNSSYWQQHWYGFGRLPEP